MTRPRAPWVTAFPLILLAGCVNLAPKPDPTRFFVLSQAIDSTAAGAPRLQAGTTVGLRSVDLPEYLDQSQLVTRAGPNEVHFLESARWGEPLGGMITRVLAADLAAAAGLKEVVYRPWNRAHAPSYAVRVVILRFELDSQQVVLHATWQAEDSTGATVVEPRPVSVSEPAAVADPEAIVSAMDRALARFSRAIVEAIRR